MTAIEQSLADLVPADWPRPEDSARPIAYVTVYRAGLLPHSPVTKHGEYFDIPGARGIVLLSTPMRPDSRAVVTTDGASGIPRIAIEVRPHVVHEGGEGVYTYLLVPAVEEDGTAVEPGLAVERTEAAVGLLTSLCSPAIAWKAQFMATVHPSGDLAPHLETVRIALAGGTPEVADDARQRFHRVGELIASQDGRDRRRIDLALRWFTRSQGEHGVDAFVSCWIAIEVLSMMAYGDRDLPELQRIMAEVYGVTAADLEDHVGLVSIYRLRNGILHEGARHEIIEPILELTARILRDLLDWVVHEPGRGLAPSYFARTVMESGQSLAECVATTADAAQLKATDKRALSLRCRTL